MREYQPSSAFIGDPIYLESDVEKHIKIGAPAPSPIIFIGIAGLILLLMVMK